MCTREEYDKYSRYTTDDFLVDDFFIRSVRQPSLETDDFWFRFLESDPSNTDDFFLAKNILLSIKDEDDQLLSDHETDLLLGKIMKANRIGVPLGRKRKAGRWITAASGAAAVAGLVLFILQDKADAPDKPWDILSYIEQVDSIDFTPDNNVKLILSEQKTVVSEEVDPYIAYDSEDIIVSAEEISRQEVDQMHQLIVPYGKRSRLTLSDGTKMWVNAGTVVTYPADFRDRTREIFVMGEVFLDVVADASRPFVVKTANFDIQVLGTKFNVSAYRNEVENVVLASGSVEVSLTGSDRAIRLEPDQMFRLEEGNATRMDVDSQLYTTWIKGIYIFDNERLDAVMNRLSKYYGLTVECSPEVGSKICSGKLNLIDKFDDILSHLSMISSIKYVSNGDYYRIF